MKALFKELFEYNHLVNQKLIELSAQYGINMPEKSIKLLNHTINAHAIWNNRISNEYKAGGVWDIRTSSELLVTDKENYENSLKILESKYLLMNIKYVNTHGETFSNLIKEIHFHVINHSTHHRAQISSDLRQHSLEPLPLDYIFYKRQK